MRLVDANTGKDHVQLGESVGPYGEILWGIDPNKRYVVLATDTRGPHDRTKRTIGSIVIKSIRKVALTHRLMHPNFLFRSVYFIET